MFERFFRSDKARSRATGGTGLGLAIVKHVAANHNGEITLWSKLGTGSTFTLRIPAHLEADSGDDDVDADGAVVSTKENGSRPSGPGRPNGVEARR
ncbi:histidine kinase [Mycobacteroides abscessus subsp. abscessus]|nr:histidine kinase [Mycobacteroides abscessus subsp. abscessus]